MDFFNEVIAPSLKEDADLSVLESSLGDFISAQNEDFTTKLRENKDVILEEKRQLAAQMKEMQERYSGLGEDFTPETYNKLISELDTYKATAADSEVEIREQLNSQYEKGKEAMKTQLDPTLNSMKMQLEEATGKMDDYQKKYQNYLAESKLRESLSSIGAEPDEFWFEGFKSNAKIEFGEDGIKDIAVKHDGGHIPIDDWKKIFPTTERGKKMIKMPVNTGAGGAGGAGGGSPTTLEDISSISDPKARQLALKEYMSKQN